MHDGDRPQATLGARRAVEPAFLSDANPVEVNGRLLQAGGQISIEDFPAQISLSSGELTLTLERIEPS